MSSSDAENVANIAVIGAGWWSQGWHLPVLHRNPKANLVAIVDTSEHPSSKLSPNLEPLSVLGERYETRIFYSVDEMLKDEGVGPKLDGAVVATPHASHYAIARQLMDERDRRKSSANDGENKPLHILMEKPMTTDIEDAASLYRLVRAEGGDSQFWINHSANYRSQTGLARETIASGKLGRIRHVTAYFSSPLKWIFNDPANEGWNKPTGSMAGNGFAWGQSSHLLAFLFHILPELIPVRVHCRMTQSATTGADVSHSATIECVDGTQDRAGDDENPELVVMSVSGTALLPGHQYTDPPVAKLVQIEVYGDDGSLHYAGNDLDPTSGCLEHRDSTGAIEILSDKFEFESYDNENYGPESIQEFLELCCGGSPTVGANVLDGLRSVQVIDAMYKSHANQRVETIAEVET